MDFSPLRDPPRAVRSAMLVTTPPSAPPQTPPPLFLAPPPAGEDAFASQRDHIPFEDDSPSHQAHPHEDEVIPLSSRDQAPGAHLDQRKVIDLCSESDSESESSSSSDTDTDSNTDSDSDSSSDSDSDVELLPARSILQIPLPPSIQQLVDARQAHLSGSAGQPANVATAERPFAPIHPAPSLYPWHLPRAQESAATINPAQSPSTRARLLPAQASGLNIPPFLPLFPPSAQAPGSTINPAQPPSVLPRPLPAAVTLTMFTDGSYKHREGMGGAGIAYQQGTSWFGRAVALGILESSDVAEMEAIRHALRMAQTIVPCIGATKLIIQSDSEYCLHALKTAATGHHTKSGQMKASLDQAMLIKAALGVEVNFWWIKAHNHAEGNERADMLANFGARQSLAGSEERVWENPIRGQLNRCMQWHAKAASLDTRDVFVTGATGPPQGWRAALAAKGTALKDEHARRRAAQLANLARQTT